MASLDEEPIEDLVTLNRYIDRNRESKKLNFAYVIHNLPEEALKVITDNVKGNPFVTDLDLRGNKFSANEAMLISKAIKVNKSMQNLHMRYNAIGRDPAGIQSICVAMKSNMSIVRLDLRSNGINSEGAKYISEMLQENTTLTHLDLAFNPLEEAGGIELLKGIKPNKYLMEVHLGGCKVGEDIIYEVTYELRCNRQKKEKDAPVVDLPVAIARFAEITKEYFEEEEKKKRFMGEEYVEYVPPVRGPFNAAYGYEIMNKLMMKERDETMPEGKLIYQHITEYVEKLLVDTKEHQKARIEAEEREYANTLGFNEREERYIREIKNIEDLLQDSLKEKERLTAIMDYKIKQKKWADEEAAAALVENAMVEEQGEKLNQNFREQIASLKQDEIDLKGKLALATTDEELVFEEVEELREYAKKFKKDIQLMIDP